jgi:endonuclease I
MNAMKLKQILLVLVLFITLVGCETTSEEPEVLLIDQVRETLVLDETYEGDILPSSIDGISITWSSNKKGTLTDNTLIQSNVDQAITLTAVLNDGENTRYKSFNITILLDESLVTVNEPDDTLYTGYYEGASDKTGTVLKAFLHDLIDDHIELSYAALWDALADSDEDPNNVDNVVLFYSGVSRYEEDHGGDLGDWNREHVWPKANGGFDTSNGIGTDMHHIRPTDVKVNNLRQNLDFDLGGSLVENTTDCFKDNDSFEPRDEVKGDVARIIFYMAVRYEGDSGELDLEINENVNNSGPYIGKLSVLLSWHLEDPVDEFEINRNEVIFSYQGNRNPFIDHPEFAEMIFTN